MRRSSGKLPTIFKQFVHSTLMFYQRFSSTAACTAKRTIDEALFFDVKTKTSLEFDYKGQTPPSIEDAEQVAEFIALDLC